MGATEQQAVLDHQAHDHEHHEDQDRYVLGFWVFLASDLVLFASIIATYFVLRTHTDGARPRPNCLKFRCSRWKPSCF